jgi:hypothetical protein
MPLMVTGCANEITKTVSYEVVPFFQRISNTVSREQGALLQAISALTTTTTTVYCAEIQWVLGSGGQCGGYEENDVADTPHCTYTWLNTAVGRF